MSATCVPWYVPHGNTGLSKHGDPVFPHFCPLNQNLVRVRTRGGSKRHAIGLSHSVIFTLCIAACTSDPRPPVDGPCVIALISQRQNFRFHSWWGGSEGLRHA